MLSRCACLQPTPTMQSPISFSLNLERGRSGTRGRFVAGRSARPFAYAIVIHLFIQIPDYNHLMPTFIVAAALCCRRYVSPWHACVVASSDKELRALRRASCDRTQPMCDPSSVSSPSTTCMCTCVRVITRKRSDVPPYRRIQAARTFRDQLISAAGNPSRLKRQSHCDVFLRRLVGGSRL